MLCSVWIMFNLAWFSWLSQLTDQAGATPRLGNHVLLQKQKMKKLCTCLQSKIFFSSFHFIHEGRGAKKSVDWKQKHKKITKIMTWSLTGKIELSWAETKSWIFTRFFRFYSSLWWHFQLASHSSSSPSVAEDCVDSKNVFLMKQPTLNLLNPR